MRRGVNAEPSAARARAEATAIEALGFLAAEPERLARFLALSGLGPDTLRQAASEPGFLLAVLDHLAADEPLLLAFAAAKGLDPSAVVAARDSLAGRPLGSEP